jgi:hypothetical protein
MKELFVVGKTTGKIDDDRWEFQGIFDSKIKAEAACIGYQYFVGPAFLNKKVPHRKKPWPGAYFPNKLAG